MSASIRRVYCAVVLLVLLTGTVQGQALRGQISLQMNGSSIQKSVAPGLHFDAQLPIVGRLSAVGGVGFSAFILEGRRNGTYSVDPKMSLKITLPSRSKGANTLLAGGGYHFQLNDRAIAGNPSVHVGVGRIWALRETTLFVDLSPTLVVRQETTAFLLPVRAGVVF